MTIGTVGGVLIVAGLVVLYLVHISVGIVMLAVGTILYLFDIARQEYQRFRETMQK